jgi:hypothetical protein
MSRERYTLKILKNCLDKWAQVSYQSNYMNIFSSHSRSTAFIKDQYFSFLETNNVSFFDISIPASIPKRSKIPPSYSSFANGGY